ncbi:MAG: hypothetical protein NTW48_09555 [Chloroflexi bacterium]|nr:hypothetical protein [Chloroflexota bacterium]
MPLDRPGPVEQFRLLVEQLEVCRDLILTGTPAKARIALILLDNIAEVILFRLSERTLNSDTYLKWIQPERLSIAEKRILDRVFKAKLELARSEHSVGEPTATILNILHSYRNAAFHRDTHNPAVVTILARVAFKAVSDLFEHTRAGIELGGSGVHDKAEMEWLTKYGLKRGFIDYEKAAHVISKQLTMEGEPSLDAVRGHLASDIHSRLTAIRRLIQKDLPWKSREELDPVLKWFEFRDAEPELEDRLSEHYRSVVYKITAGQQVDVKPDELHALEVKFRAEYEKRLEAYQQHISFDEIGRLEARIRELSEAVTFSSLLKNYYEIDCILSTLERYLYLAFQEFDRAVQLEIDLRLGK